MSFTITPEIIRAAARHVQDGDTEYACHALRQACIDADVVPEALVQGRSVWRNSLPAEEWLGEHLEADDIPTDGSWADTATPDDKAEWLRALANRLEAGDFSGET